MRPKRSKLSLVKLRHALALVGIRLTVIAKKRTSTGAKQWILDQLQPALFTILQLSVGEMTKSTE